MAIKRWSFKSTKWCVLNIVNTVLYDTYGNM